MEIKAHVIFGNPIAVWAAAGIVAAAVWSGLLVMRSFMTSRHRRYATAQRLTPIRLVLYLLANTRQFFLFALALAAGAELLAGLGVGGVAVALALQNVLGNLFASLSIALDKPFVVGDLLTIDGFVGTVERIGIKTTRLRSDGGEQIILSNADILKSRVRNFGPLPELRALATSRVPYATAQDKLAAIPKLPENIVHEQSNVRFERCHLKTLGDSCLNFELSYFVQLPKINSSLDLQQAVNLRIIEEFRRTAIEFAFPSQRILVEREPV